MKIEWWCIGKTAYPTKAKALERIERQHRDRYRSKRKGWSGDQTMNPYLCETCGQWHVGGTSRQSANKTDKFGHIERFDMKRPKGFDRHGRRKELTKPTTADKK